MKKVLNFTISNVFERDFLGREMLYMIMYVVKEKACNVLSCQIWRLKPKYGKLKMCTKPGVIWGHVTSFSLDKIVTLSYQNKKNQTQLK